MGIKVPPRRYEKTTYLQKANARPPQHRKVMGLHRQQRATDLDCYELRTAKQANQRRGARRPKFPKFPNEDTGHGTTCFGRRTRVRFGLPQETIWLVTSGVTYYR